MQDAATEQALAKSLDGARSPLGKAGGRALKQARSMTQLPSAPDGHYVVAQYTTQFAQEADAVETVVASQAPDGSWHVAGYFIR